MATQTQTLRRGPVTTERVHDYLYDNHYTVASERDHARATFKAHTSTQRVQKIPNYPTMFSDLRHCPRFHVKLDPTDPVPKFINRQWRGYAEQSREALVRHTTFNYDPSVQVPPKHFENVQVSGPNRFKYFRRPIIPFNQQVAPDVVLASDRQDPLMEGMGGGAQGALAQAQRAASPQHKTIMTQTDYRESEAQTDPFTPEYVVRPGSQPEVLTLITLAWGRGLPAGQAEVEMIERARQKREWEATLPPLSDTSQLDKRRKMMDEMETKEWALREAEIEKLQEMRLEVLKELLERREEHHQVINTKSLDRLWAQKQEQKEAKIKHIRNQYIQMLRKLERKRANVENKLERRDITMDYSSLASQIYAPKTRLGVFWDRGSEANNVKSHYLGTYQGLCELEDSLPMFALRPRIKEPKRGYDAKDGYVKRKNKHENILTDLHKTIKARKMHTDEEDKPLRYLEQIEKPIPRPATPCAPEPDQEEEECQLATIFLQQCIRGRAIQNMMFEGKEKRIELIRELRSTHALQEGQQLGKRQEKQATLALQRQRRLHEHKESYVDEGLAALEGASMGDTLDFLSKELVRLQEERKVHAFSMLAERQRRIREAEESGRRQVEERRRREEDEIFKQTVKVHQDSVDTYLEDIIMGSIQGTAQKQARDEIQAKAKVINDVAYDMEDRRTHLESQEIVAELVHGFLIPEVQKETLRERVHAKQRKHLLAAHREIHKAGEGIIEMFPNRPKKSDKDDDDDESKREPSVDRAASPGGSFKEFIPKADEEAKPTPATDAQAPQESAPQESAPQESAPQESAPQEAEAPKEAE